MAKFPSSARHPRFLFVLAIVIIGAVVGLAIHTALKPESVEGCVAREMYWQPQGNLPHVQRDCAKRHRANQG
jgi:hypothetical protein